MPEFYTALDSAVGTSTAMIGALGAKGILILVAVLTAGITILFIKLGARKGVGAMKGKIT